MGDHTDVRQCSSDNSHTVHAVHYDHVQPGADPLAITHEELSCRVLQLVVHGKVTSSVATGYTSTCKSNSLHSGAGLHHAAAGAMPRQTAR